MELFVILVTHLNKLRNENNLLWNLSHKLLLILDLLCTIWYTILANINNETWARVRAIRSRQTAYKREGKDERRDERMAILRQ